MSDQHHHHDVLQELLPQHRELRKQIPEVYKGFAALSGAALADGALSHKVKELMALAIGVVQGCDGCIASHAQAAARAGATPEEAAEAIGVTILMHGGPADHLRRSGLHGLLRIRRRRAGDMISRR